MGKTIAIIGGGGKTTSLLAISQYLQKDPVLMTTTTHILPVSPPTVREYLSDPTNTQLLKSLSEPGIVCAGREEALPEHIRLCPLPDPLLDLGRDTAARTVCEADGAARLPLKLHKPTEPVIPENSDLCLLVFGLSALGKPISETVHRYALNPQWAEAPETTVTSRELEFCLRENIRVTGMEKEKLRILLNQKDSLPDPSQAEALARKLTREGYQAMAGSMQSDPEPILTWLFP